ncbi:hypothetical protein Mro03_50930 [Microbispora rosea subsp. rosea]|nr:hypothetical protein Mro03_50930 [Microbispora rosea subsp. rosea]
MPPAAIGPALIAADEAPRQAGKTGPSEAGALTRSRPSYLLRRTTTYVRRRERARPVGTNVNANKAAEPGFPDRLSPRSGLGLP